ncbi:MAG TPA: RDD family protein [Methylomirabilota bacterium]|jgi:uncharacterized RDD family membrane protein YckC
MDDAREWTATAPRSSAGAPAMAQPGDPWGAPAWVPDARAADEAYPASAAPAGIQRRGAALVVDLVIVMILWVIGAQLAAGLARRAPGLDLVAQAFGWTWQLVVPAAYFVLSHGTAGQTLGKRFLGVRVTDEGGGPLGYLRALGRCVATVVAAMPFGIGLAVAGLRRDRRGLHDLLAGTRVVRVR